MSKLFVQNPLLSLSCFGHLASLIFSQRVFSPVYRINILANFTLISHLLGKIVAVRYLFPSRQIAHFF